MCLGSTEVSFWEFCFSSKDKQTNFIFNRQVYGRSSNKGKRKQFDSKVYVILGSWFVYFYIQRVAASCRTSHARGTTILRRVNKHVDDGRSVVTELFQCGKKSWCGMLKQCSCIFMYIYLLYILINCVKIIFDDDLDLYL